MCLSYIMETLFMGSAIEMSVVKFEYAVFPLSSFHGIRWSFPSQKYIPAPWFKRHRQLPSCAVSPHVQIFSNILWLQICDTDFRFLEKKIQVYKFCINNSAKIQIYIYIWTKTKKYVRQNHKIQSVKLQFYIVVVTDWYSLEVPSKSSFLTLFFRIQLNKYRYFAPGYKNTYNSRRK